MHDVTANLYPCAHCKGTGTCTNDDGFSCAVCHKEHEIKGKHLTGLPCAVCGGIGLAEPKTERINKRIPAIIGMMVVFSLLFTIFYFALVDNKHFSEILAFAGTTIGSVLGFYFTSKAKTAGG